MTLLAIGAAPAGAAGLPWSAPKSIYQPPAGTAFGHRSGFSCPSTSLCVAGDANGNAMVSTDSAATKPTWSQPTGSTRRRHLHTAKRGTLKRSSV